MKKAPAVKPGPPSIVKIVTSFSFPAGAGKRGYPDGHRPVARGPQALGGRGCPTPAAPGAAHTLIPVRDSSFAEQPCAAACGRGAAARPVLRRERQSAARFPRRGGQG